MDDLQELRDMVDARRTTQSQDTIRSRAKRLAKLSSEERKALLVSENEKVKLRYAQSPTMRAKSAKYNLDNRERFTITAKIRRRARKKQIVAHFGGRCKDCDNEYPYSVFEFHHLDPKTKDGPLPYTSMEKTLAYVKGCVMLCSNCHRVRHHGT